MLGCMARYMDITSFFLHIPKLFCTFANGIIISKKMKVGRVVLRPPEEITISRLEKDSARLEQVYKLGLKDAAAQWQALEEYLAK